MEKIVSENATITIIKEGYAYIDGDGWMRANASCTLVQTAESVVIVDTLTPWDGPFILESNNLRFHIYLRSEFNKLAD